MRIRTLVVVLTVLAGSMPGIVRAGVLPADVVNVDFNTSDHGSTEYSGLAAGPVTAGTKWNSVTLGIKLNNGFSTTHNFGPTSAGALVDSGNAATPFASSVTVEVDLIHQYMTDENPLSDANGGKLLNDYAYVPSDATSSTLKIGGLSGDYDLYLYSENGAYQSQTSTFTIGATTKTANNTLTSTGVFTLGRNYVEFSGLSVSGTLTVTFGPTSGGSLDGFQLVRIPEPASLSLAALAALTLLLRRRRVESL